ncbi:MULTISPECIES: serine hydrolase domain-containing protein [Rhizobium]|uniref:Serine hydrolase n=1 Tax=Rhizobium rhododendri TaxID=2506430 RepID=A0ABY8IS24_9HYPH|nr:MULTISPECIES: serine hydrolase domain-containing protein [Rhizobium]TQX84460.1 class A beta-lactamase-related serine hydrolase [Rhizobium sp. rho-13.1]TQY08193.1 class A beta-lactamase-related serine hydrolase [Rhizobium sp. rho-1.1]WFS26280.1 serine hydrolase [Rhizobium rhododendri]
MTPWLNAALAYVERWMEYQMTATELPGCQLAVAKDGVLVLERAFGVANLATGTPLTTSHRFRVASHSKTFTAAGIMKLHEERRLHLDDLVGTYVPGLHQSVADVTIGQLLSHASGLMRDGTEAPHWQVRQPFFDAEELGIQLAHPLAIDANTRFKYSNLGFGLLGSVIEAITGETYIDWIAREIVVPSGLEQTVPDMPLAEGVPVSSGHSGRVPFGRGSIRGDNPTFALAAATGFVSTAGDLSRFFASLDPEAETSVLSVASRREMTRRHWRVPQQADARHYGLGTISMDIKGHALFGHAGAFPGFISRTSVVPEWGLSLSIVTNAIDGPANAWVEGIVSIFDTFASYGAPDPTNTGWAGRWWTLWGAVDLVPVGDSVLLADPAALQPFNDATMLAIDTPDSGRIVEASGFASHGEGIRRTLAADGSVQRLYLGSSELVKEPADLAIKRQPPRQAPSPR